MSHTHASLSLMIQEESVANSSKNGNLVHFANYQEYLRTRKVLNGYI